MRDLEEHKRFRFIISNLINLLFLHLESELDEQRSHKVVTVIYEIKQDIRTYICCL